MAGSAGTSRNGALKGQKGQEGHQEDQQEDLQEGRETKANQQGLVLTCSALRRVYRDFLREAMPDGLRFVFPMVSSRRADGAGHPTFTRLFPA